MATLHESEQARGVHIYSTSDPSMPSAIIINSAKIYREKIPEASMDYALDIVVFHELGHCATKNIFKNVYITSKRELLPALILKESLACYYSYLCLADLYEQNDSDMPEQQSFIEDMNFFSKCIRDLFSSNLEEDGYSFLFNPTDIGNIIGQILVYCKPIADKLSINGKDIFEGCSDSALASSIYDFSCMSLDIIKKNELSKEDKATYCKKFGIILSNASSI